jgi:hypothetical protein
MLAGCVPEYNPWPDAGGDASDAPLECMPMPADIGIFPPEFVDPASFETETGYDHRGGVGDDRGVIHHEAFVSRIRDDNTLLTFQDFLGPDRVRSPGTTYRLEDEFVDEDDGYLDCDLCVLYLIGCPYESLGGCQQVFLAVGGEVTFDQFEKADGSWSQDTIEKLAVTMTGLRLREVIIDPVSFSTRAACPTRSCPANEGEPESCLLIDSYSFSYDGS